MRNNQIKVHKNMKKQIPKTFTYVEQTRATKID